MRSVVLGLNLKISKLVYWFSFASDWSKAQHVCCDCLDHVVPRSVSYRAFQMFLTIIVKLAVQLKCSHATFLQQSDFLVDAMVELIPFLVAVVVVSCFYFDSNQVQSKVIPSHHIS